MNILFLRRRALGAGSIRGVIAASRGEDFVDPNQGVIRYFRDDFSVLRGTGMQRRGARAAVDRANLIVRWGSTYELGHPPGRVLNSSAAIHRVNNKRTFRETLVQEENDIVPATVSSSMDLNGVIGELPERMILRPERHAQGRQLWEVNPYDLLDTVRRHGLTHWYASEYINKVAEYRVYVANGRVLTVAQKTPENPDAVAWNVNQGGRFDVVRWDDWPLAACDASIRAFRHSGLDFGGVDVMIDAEGRCYILEINSAPSLPPLDDGRVSYRQKCMARYFNWVLRHGTDQPVHELDNGWRGFVHGAIWLPREQREAA